MSKEVGTLTVMVTDIYAKLSKRFPTKLIKTKPGGGGAKYLPNAQIISRLNDVLGVDGWTWTFEWTRIDDGILADGVLTALGVTSRGIDGHQISKAKDPKVSAKEIKSIEMLSTAIKSAESGALVRAARRLGVGLELWADGGASPLDGELAEEVAEGAAPATEDQLFEIGLLGRGLGYDDAGLAVIVHDLIDADIHGLTSDQAGSMIARLTGLDVKRRGELYSRVSDARDALGWDNAKLISDIGNDPRKIPTADLAVIADQLEARAASKDTPEAKPVEPVADTKGGITDRQLKAATAIAKVLDWQKEDLRKHCVETYGMDLGNLCKGDASALIVALQGMVVKAGS